MIVNELREYRGARRGHLKTAWFDVEALSREGWGDFLLRVSLKDLESIEDERGGTIGLVGEADGSGNVWVVLGFPSTWGHQDPKRHPIYPFRIEE